MTAGQVSASELGAPGARGRGLVASVFGAAALICLVVATGCGKHEDTASTKRDEPKADTAMRYVDSPNKATGTPVVPKFIPADHPAPKPTEALAEGATCVRPECHASMGVADRIHGPVAANACFACHEADTGGHVYRLKRSGNATCAFCHQTGKTAMLRHEALDEPGCIGCHDPHAGRRFLLKAEDVQATCAECHALDEGTRPHGPYAEGECAACHNPHESNNAHLLRGGSGSVFCFTCHAETKYVLDNAPYIHQPAHEDCTECHSPHVSNHQDHLIAPIEELCLSCHTGLEETVSGSKTPHAAVFTEQSCANCHDPHASGRPHLLRDRQTTVCLSCHDKPVKADDGRTIPDMTASVTQRRFLHGPVESGDCSACHNVHGSSHDRLLRQEFPKGFYSKFDLQNYALCFSCHPQDLVLTEKTTSLTDFRDGDQNLHYLHVNRDEKGRSCKSCHAIHGSDLERHLATEVPFDDSQWMMPIDFKRLPDGGSCAPGCHVAMTYHRSPPGDGNSSEDGTAKTGDQP